MKKIILLLLFSFSGFAQTAVYNKIKEAGKFTEYQTKSGNLIKVGDTITIGYPRSGDRYTFIFQAQTNAGTAITNKKVVISEIKTTGNKTRGFTTHVLFKGWGWYPVYIDYESALETGEIKNPFE